MSQQREVSERDLLLDGYFRRMEKILDLKFPKDIVYLIKTYHLKWMIFGIGSNSYGQFGLGENTKYRQLEKFTKLKELQNLVSNINNIYPNSKSLSIITNNGDVYAAGDNSYRRLAIISSDKYSTIKEFSQIHIHKRIKLISHGTTNERHTFILTENNQLYASGCNFSGVFGDETEKGSIDALYQSHQVDYTQFLIHQKDEYITFIECGRSCSLWLTNYGLVYGAGFIGGTEISTKKAKLIQMNNDNVPIIMIRAGYDSMLALDEKYRLIVAGNNDLGKYNQIH